MLQGNQKHFATRILTLTAISISHQILFGLIIVMAWGLVAEVAAAELSGAERALNSATKILHFPADRVIGRLSAGSDTGDVEPDDDWEFVGLARGDVAVPANRNIQLAIDLGTGPGDLSFLSRLDSSDLYKFSIQASDQRSSANRPRLEALSHLTGLQILSLSNTGVPSRQMSGW